MHETLKCVHHCPYLGPKNHLNNLSKVIVCKFFLLSLSVHIYVLIELYENTSHMDLGHLIQYSEVHPIEPWHMGLGSQLGFALYPLSSLDVLPNLEDTLSNHFSSSLVPISMLNSLNLIQAFKYSLNNSCWSCFIMTYLLDFHECEYVCQLVGMYTMCTHLPTEARGHWIMTLPVSSPPVPHTY